MFTALHILHKNVHPLKNVKKKCEKNKEDREGYKLWNDSQRRETYGKGQRLRKQEFHKRKGIDLSHL